MNRETDLSYQASPEKKHMRLIATILGGIAVVSLMLSFAHRDNDHALHVESLIRACIDTDRDYDCDDQDLPYYGPIYVDGVAYNPDDYGELTLKGSKVPNKVTIRCRDQIIEASSTIKSQTELTIPGQHTIRQFSQGFSIPGPLECIE